MLNKYIFPTTSSSTPRLKYEYKQKSKLVWHAKPDFFLIYYIGYLNIPYNWKMYYINEYTIHWKWEWDGWFIQFLFLGVILHSKCLIITPGNKISMETKIMLLKYAVLKSPTMSPQVSLVLRMSLIPFLSWFQNWKFVAGTC